MPNTSSHTSPLLILAPSDKEAALLVEHVGIPHIKHLRIADATGLRAALREPPWGGLLYLHGLYGLTASAALKIVQELEFDLPFIIITPPAEEKEAVQAMRAGAHDVVSLDRLDRLAPAVEREMREARHRTDHRAALDMLKESEARFRTLTDNLPDMVFHLHRNAEGHYRFLYLSTGCHRLFGIKQIEILASAKKFFDAIEPDDRHDLESHLAESAATQSPLDWKGRMRGRNRGKWIYLRSTPQQNNRGDITWQGIATDITRTQEIEEELRSSREQLSELSSHTETVREEERERIARDIHDEQGSILVRLKIEASLLIAKLPATLPLLREKALSIEKLLDQAMTTTSRIARELRPGILKEFGLAAAIESLAEDFSQHCHIVCRVQCDNNLDPDADTSLALFRIVQEALTNVAKHSGASLVFVRMKRL
ncbi:MAG: PAS domain S-box protein, partial [Rhodocyclaceae bacterium]|nr:PAS domain S-box protein [Rhodocyclaceae bacterium]